MLPDPNMFTGRTAITRPFSHRGTDPGTAAAAEQPWTDVPEEGVVVGRGLGVLDMARAIRTGRPHRATGELGYHVLDTMVSAQESAARGSSSRSRARSSPSRRFRSTSTRSPARSEASPCRR